MLVHLTPIAVLACCVLAAALNTSTLKPDLGNIFAVYPGWTMTNPNDAATPRGISELACQQTCSADATCLGYIYFPYGGPNVPTPLCTLRNSITLNFAVEPGIVTSVGLIGGCGTFSPIGPTICQSVTVLPVSA
ncbi:hypothetical protein B0H13DRAFT_2338157 [Mycena leptocephala]|nr:hypothetical protein B0H13DRAFT_2339689 [Mycena leptocephala]KAJ7896867.1 hypothetical protein B0H13DRAFT_2338157 [Mycena leptocephala]